MATTIINLPLGKTLFQRLLNSKKSKNAEIIYFDKTTTENWESNNKIFDIDETIFYKPFEIEINYDITGKSQKQTFAFFCCRKVSANGKPSIHVFSINEKLTLDMSSVGGTKRINTGLILSDTGKINIKYNEGNIQVYFDDKLKNTYDLSDYKLTSGLPSKCGVGQSFTENNNSLANGINGTVNVKIKELKE